MNQPMLDISADEGGSVSVEELQKLLEMTDEDSGVQRGPWTTERREGGWSGDNWGVASFGTNDDGTQSFVTTDRVRVSELGYREPRAEAEYVAYVHPLRVRRLVQEIWELRLWKRKHSALVHGE